MSIESLCVIVGRMLGRPAINHIHLSILAADAAINAEDQFVRPFAMIKENDFYNVTNFGCDHFRLPMLTSGAK